ncbi:hypothetical protein [Parasitella parasitica]|uniref:Uncharacterized protein n=1 Tax=Parasitella parasitica TaxID=35722 RepID=A0A0B7NP63_9FUNG|nr:hypothetical protein [Parasitella parasitica]
MNTIWDAATWLTANFTTRNGLPEFFIEGCYPCDHREKAENDYKDTVNALLNTTSDEGLKSWCTLMINSDFLVLKLTTTTTFWRVLTQNQTDKSQEDNILSTIFRYYKPKNNTKLPAEQPATTVPATRRKIIIQEPHVLIKAIKSLSESQFRHYNQLSERQKYFTMCGVNDVFELTDTKESSHLHVATEEQQRILCNKELEDLEYDQIGVIDDDLAILMKKRKFTDLNCALYSRLGQASSKDFTTLKIISYITETYVHYSSSLLPDVFNKLSEASVIIKFWSTIIETLFCKTKLIVNWGDTISYGPEKTNRKMDLRILYNLDNNSNDVANGEFGKSVSRNKYFEDKSKLVINGKCQLNNILKITHDPTIRVALLLIQGLQAELYSIRLLDNGLYVLERLKYFRFPRKSTYIADLNELIDGLSLLSALCLQTNQKYNDSLLEKEQMNSHAAYEVPSKQRLVSGCFDSKIFVLCYVIADAQLQRFQDRLAQITEVSCGFINNSFLNSTYLIHQYFTVLVRLCARCAQQYKPETDASHNGLS